MTKDKDFKRLVRARMEKTGEAYTTARAHLLSRRPVPLPDGYEKVAGMSDDAVAKATGLTWPEWTRLLDARGAHAMEHRAIADIVLEEPGVSGWWSQMVTVAYERFRDLRDVGQRRGGGYEASKTKTVPVPVSRLWEAIHDDAIRSRWMPDLDAEVTSGTRPKSVNLRLADGTRVTAWLTAKGDAKSSVSLQHAGLPDRKAAEASKAFWGERLGALADLLREG